VALHELRTNHYIAEAGPSDATPEIEGQIHSREGETVRSRTARLMTALHESGRITFAHAGVESITGLPPSLARSSGLFSSALKMFSA